MLVNMKKGSDVFLDTLEENIRIFFYLRIIKIKNFEYIYSKDSDGDVSYII